MARLANRNAAGKVATGKTAARKTASDRGRPVRNEYPARDDPHNAIDLEFLRIWMRISQLREKLRDDRHAASHTSHR